MTLHLAVLPHEPETTLGVFAPLLDDVELELVRTGGALPDAQAFDGAIVLGGSLGAYDATLLEARRWVRDAVLTGRPVLTATSSRPRSPTRQVSWTSSRGGSSSAGSSSSRACAP